MIKVGLKFTFTQEMRDDWVANFGDVVQIRDLEHEVGKNFTIREVGYNRVYVDSDLWTFPLKLLEKHKKSFIKVGIRRMDGSWTEEGTHLFVAWLKTKVEEEFVEEVVKPLVEADKKSKKK